MKDPEDTLKFSILWFVLTNLERLLSTVTLFLVVLITRDSES